MSEISRREFFKNAATSAAVAGLLSGGSLELRANPLGMPIGCQTWPVRTMIAKNFPGTIKQLAAAGFQTIERSEEHTSELQSLTNLVCRLLLEKKKKKK